MHQLNIQTCIDFSERRVHLAGKLGNDVMAKLVAEHQLALTQNRRVQVTQPIKIQPLEVLICWLKQTPLRMGTNQ